GPPLDRHLRAAQGRHPQRPAGHAAGDRVPRPPPDRAAHGRLHEHAGERPAGGRVRGGGARPHLHPQRHAPRRAVPLLLPHERAHGAGRRAVVAHRPGAARMVLPARGQARLPAPARRPRGAAGRGGGRAAPHRPRDQAAGDRGGEHPGREPLRRGRLHRQRLRHGQGRDALAAGARRAAGGHGRLVLGRALQRHEEAPRRRRLARPHLGRPPRGARDRLLAPGEAEQPGSAAARRLPGGVLPGEGPPRLGRLDPRGGDTRRL
ncbi:MAG: Cyclase, partial [uncultured Acetobacteraceae bacterium]